MTYSSLLASSTRQGLVVASDLSEALKGLKGTPQKTLGSDLDPIEEISRILRNDPLDQLNIVAHGTAGSIDLGTGLDKEVLVANQQQLAEWNVKEIVLWSCDVAQDKEFIALLEEFTGAKVIASQHKLGLGNTILDTGFDELATIISGLKFELHTNSVGFDVQDASSGTQGLFDVSVFYGTYHPDHHVEGALSLYEPKDGFSLDSE